MTVSSIINDGDDILASQYNNLRKDVIDATLGHDHNTTGKNVPPAGISPQGAASTLDADKLDGLHATGLVRWLSGALWQRPAAGNAGTLYFATDLGDTGVIFYDTGSFWYTLSPIVIRKLAPQVVYNSTSNVNDNHFQFPIAAYESWSFELWVTYVATNTGNMRMTFWCPPGGSCPFSRASITGTPVVNKDPVYVAAPRQSNLLLRGWGLGTTAATHIMGYAKNGATPGDVKFQWSQWTAETSNLTVSGGWMFARQIFQT